MNEIKFRAKRIDNREWVYGYYFYLELPLQCIKTDETEQGKSFILTSGFADWNMTRPIESHEVDPDTVEMYTGQKDIHDKEIYENNILKTDEADWIAKVIWSYDGFMLTGLDNKGFSIDPDYKSCEIIGDLNE